MKTSETEDWIDQQWQQKLARGMRPWPNDTKPSRYRLVNIEEDEGQLTITLDPCVSYRDFVGSCTPEFIERFGQKCNPNPLAVSVALRAKDKNGIEYVFLTIRKNVDYKKGGYHASIGGFMDIKRDCDPVSAITGEIKEECGIEAYEIEDLRCIAAAYNPNEGSYHTDLVFTARATITVEEILTRQKDEENEGLVYIPATRSSIEEWLAPTTHANVIIAMVGLLLLGKDLPDDDREKGKTWYERMLGILAEESACYDSEETRKFLETRDIERFTEMVAHWRKTHCA